MGDYILDKPCGLPQMGCGRVISATEEETMADQTVKLTNDAGSHERVAYDLWRYLLGRNSDEIKNLKTNADLLKLYRQCLGATFRPEQ